MNQFEIMSSTVEIWQKNLTLVKCDKSFFKRFACYESLKIGRFSAKTFRKKIPSQLWLHSFWNIFRDLNVVRILTHVKSPSLHSSRKKVEKFFPDSSEKNPWLDCLKRVNLLSTSHSSLGAIPRSQVRDFAGKIA